MADVIVLLQGFQETRQHFSDKFGFDCFINSASISSALHLAYRKDYMEEGSLVSTPTVGINAQRKFSKECLLWLAWMSHKNNDLQIQSAMNGPEIQWAIPNHCGHWIQFVFLESGNISLMDIVS